MRSPDPARLVLPASGGGALPTPSADAPSLSVGNTPLVRLEATARAAGGRFELWGKLEGVNPSGSVKDRAAAEIVRTAIRSGVLGPGRTLVDASSGNTAVAYARLGKELGFSVRLFLPRNANPERLARLTALGATVVLTDPGEGTDGAQEEARRFAESDPEGCFYADQYRNPANPRAHYLTTGPEIWRQTDGRVTHLVCGVGTGGTVSGTGRFLKERNPAVQVIAVEPDEPMHGLEGLKHLPTAHRPETYDPSVVDRTERVGTEEALATRREVLAREGLPVGPSAAAAIVAAVRVGRSNDGAVVVAVLPDLGPPTTEER